MCETRGHQATETVPVRETAMTVSSRRFAERPGAVPFSFEVYPPRTPDATAALHESVERLADAGPRFISVTFGAGGSTGGRSLELLRHIRESTDVEPLAHLTCVGHTTARAEALVREFLDAGIDRFLALRGDPPAGLGEDDAFRGELTRAADLVRLIRRVRAERGIHDGPGAPDIAVAAFPNGHPRARHAHHDVDVLLEKQAAGATFAITQVVFRADDHLAFAERARRAGVHIPIVPGIMPVTSPARLRRVLELTGEREPTDLALDLELAPDADARREVGVAHAARLARALLEGGASGIHLYAFNVHDTVLAVLREAGIPTHEKETAR